MTAHAQSHNERKPNRLVSQTSPYLLQHAYNPVDWFPWGAEALQKAKDEDKPIIVSIGYSACHWCHVMERESFENETIAELMNGKFVCIKVDREERPDVDTIYMEAVQAMGERGGWPLNVFLTPDAKPFFGGTYFPPRDWGQLLINVADAYQNQRDQILDSAEQFTEHISLSESFKFRLEGGETTYSQDDLTALFTKLASKFDKAAGGTGKAPKFPMPGIYLFLLRYFHATQSADAHDQLKLTLDRMAFGGIYDQIGGGFARYSVDGEWFAPHFEKMLYDNGQLVSLYTEAYSCLKHDLYKDIVFQTVEFIEREMTSLEGGFYSALDADSEGIEGRFYVWTEEEWRQATANMQFSAGITADLFKEYYHVDPEGNWEHGYNILYRTMRDNEFALLNGLDPIAFEVAHDQFKEAMLRERGKRSRPGLDDKILCSWNGLMLRGLVDAYRVFADDNFLSLALMNARFLKEKMRNGNALWHSYKNGKATIAGYLEDYAFVIDAYIGLYQATFEESWLQEAKVLTGYVVENFYDADEELFYFTDATAEKLIARKKELFDNVIPSSNSAMAKNLYWLGILLDKPYYIELSDKMLSRVKKLITSDPQYLSNWAGLLSCRTKPTAEIAIIGPQADAFRQEIEQMYCPNKVLAGAAHDSDLPLLENREAIGGKTTIYVCYNKTCQLPVHSVKEAMAQALFEG
jgi:hypothetical protein